ncbi:MAG TPA: hypothetical protein VHT50_12730, partial [Mycobacterium sp.]|nr:hypothetical protein [Mycobacterium sp.]
CSVRRDGSGTLRELISVGLRFFSLSTLHVSIALLEGPADCEIVLDAGHLPDDVRRFFVERDIAGVVATVPTFVHPVLARYVDRISLELAADEAYLRPLLDMVAIRDVEFGSERSVIRAPKQMLDEPLPQADPRTRWPCVSSSASGFCSAGSTSTGCRPASAPSFSRRRGRCRA